MYECYESLFSDKKWVPVDINITTKRPSGKVSRGNASKSDSKNWREDAAAAAVASAVVNTKGIFKVISESRYS